jgi:endonuclease/exonuclease/phosphatase family metal-dependent hydrolase
MKTFKKIVFVLNIIIATMLIMVYFSVHISPEKTVAVALLPLVYVALVIINLVFAVFWLIFKWKYSLISFGAIVAGVKFINLIFPVMAMFSSQQASADLKIMTYNVKIFGLYDWGNNSEIKTNIFRIIDVEDPGIICIQEVYWNNSQRNFVTLDSIKLLLDAEYCFKAVMATAVGGQNFGLATVSRYPIVNSFSHKFEDAFNGFIYTDILINEDTVRVYNLHLQSIQLNQNDYTMIEEFSESEDNTKMKLVLKKYLSSLTKRAPQVEMVRASIDSCDYPVFICGDFNDGPLSYAYFTIAEGLKDSFVTDGKYPGYTWDNFNIKQRIDYVLYDKKFDCIFHKVISEHYSDHFAVVAGFDLEGD